MVSKFFFDTIKLNRKYEEFMANINTIPHNVISAESDSNEELKAVKISLDLLLKERLELRQQLIRCESKLKKIDVSIDKILMFCILSLNH